MYPYANLSAAYLTHKIETAAFLLKSVEWCATPVDREMQVERLKVLQEERERRLRYNGKLRSLPPCHRDTWHGWEPTVAHMREAIRCMA